MSERVKLTAKIPVAKKKNLLAKVQKPDFSQSMNSPVDHILFLQKNIGNQAVQRLFKSGLIQAKFRIGKSNDIYEQEADRTAGLVMRMPDPTPQRKGPCPTGMSSCEQEKEEVIQPKPLKITPSVLRQIKEEEEILQSKGVSGPTLELAPNIESKINLMMGSGYPLSESVRTFFESRFGYDFSKVRIHNDSRAVESATAINARAFTIGQNIAFGSGMYAPQTPEGKRLMSHELTHVVQQKHGHVCSPTSVQRKLEMQGGKAEDFLQFLLRVTGRNFDYDPTTHLVGPPLRDPFENPLRRMRTNVAVEKLNEVITDSTYTARIFVDVQGRFPQVVILGQFTPMPGSQQLIDFDHIDGLERAVPGAGLALAVHEIYERYRFERIPAERRPGPEATHPAGPAHQEASLLEPLILKQYGLTPGRRLSDDMRLTGPAGRQKLIFTIRYQNLDLMIIFRVDLSKSPGQFHFERATVRRHHRKGKGV